MASFSFSMRFRSSARSRSTCCGEGVLGWWVRQAGSAQTLTTCPRFHDDRLSHLVAWFLVRGELATCTICFRLFDLQFDILIPPQGSAFAGIPRRRNLDELRFGFQSLSHGSLDLGPETVGRSALCGIRMSTSGNKSVTRSLTLIKCRQRQRLETATDAVARPRSSASATVCCRDVWPLLRSTSLVRVSRCRLAARSRCRGSSCVFGKPA